MDLWQHISQALQQETSEEDFNVWIRPLQLQQEREYFTVYAPNSFIRDHINSEYAVKIRDLLIASTGILEAQLQIKVGNFFENADKSSEVEAKISLPIPGFSSLPASQYTPNPAFNFVNYVEGKSNQLALAAARQVSSFPGEAYNPLFIYGGVGLGKTHLMHAIGNEIMQRKGGAKVLYLHSEVFVADMVKALQKNMMNEFKRYYRTVDALLIDDIQFFAGKDRSQEEFFHTFNALLDSRQQVILSSDRVPKAIDGVEERLKSRFGWGLTVAVEPPELETRVAILMSKAEQFGVDLASDVAFFIAKRIQSNVRELEGALKRVNAHAKFANKAITIEFAQEALKDLLAVHAQLVSVENIQKTVADYYKLRVSDLLASKRSRSFVVARQMAMALTKDLTSLSLPEIGRAFGGRDHTTVLHACRKMKELMENDMNLAKDYERLIRIITA